MQFARYELPIVQFEDSSVSCNFEDSSPPSCNLQDITLLSCNLHDRKFLIGRL